MGLSSVSQRTNNSVNLDVNHIFGIMQSRQFARDPVRWTYAREWFARILRKHKVSFSQKPSLSMIL